MNKLENNWQYKTLENLEKEVLPIEYESRLLNRVKKLWKIQLIDFTIEDLRLMIGQGIGLNYLMPLAIEVLMRDVFAEGDFYEGDLLQSVLNVNTDFWNDNKEHWILINDLIKINYSKVIDLRIDVANFEKVIH
jgi:hypothetical protein